MKFPSLITRFFRKPLPSLGLNMTISIKITSEQNKLLNQQVKALKTTRSKYVRNRVFGGQL